MIYFCVGKKLQDEKKLLTCALLNFALIKAINLRVLFSLNIKLVAFNSYTIIYTLCLIFTKL
jgi:hypothetical protein